MNPVGASTLTLGDLRITHLADGYHRCHPLGSIVGSTADDWAAHPHLLDRHGRLVMTMGALLVETADGRRVLIDAGFGPRSLILEDLRMEFWGGRLLRSLAALGLTPDDIEVVAFSHLHLDHVGWTTGTGETLTFPAARHVMSGAEWAHWTAPDRIGGPSDADLAALPARLELVDGEQRIAPGVTALPTPGHTPGHLSFRLESGQQRAIVLGDAVHCPLQITHPEWNYAGDVVPEAASRARHQLVAELEQPDTVVVGAHFTDAVFGRVLAGTSPRQVAFDVVPPLAPQPVAPDAPPGSLFLPPLD